MCPASVDCAPPSVWVYLCELCVAPVSGRPASVLRGVLCAPVGREAAGCAHTDTSGWLPGGARRRRRVPPGRPLGLRRLGPPAAGAPPPAGGLAHLTQGRPQCLLCNRSRRRGHGFVPRAGLLPSARGRPAPRTRPGPPELSRTRGLRSSQAPPPGPAKGSGRASKLLPVRAIDGLEPKWLRDREFTHIVAPGGYRAMCGGRASLPRSRGVCSADPQPFCRRAQRGPRMPPQFLRLLAAIAACGSLPRLAAATEAAHARPCVDHDDRWQAHNTTCRTWPSLGVRDGPRRRGGSSTGASAPAPARLRLAPPGPTRRPLPLPPPGPL